MVISAAFATTGNGTLFVVVPPGVGTGISAHAVPIKVKSLAPSGLLPVPTGLTVMVPVGVVSTVPGHSGSTSGVTPVGSAHAATVTVAKPVGIGRSNKSTLVAATGFMALTTGPLPVGNVTGDS